MKKLYLFFALLIAHCNAFAQTIPGGDMETWRTSLAGAASPVSIQAPFAWNGADSLIIAYGQTFGPFIGRPDPTIWKRQLYMENAFVHGGSHAARVTTRNQDTLGIFPGILSNAKANVPISLTGGVGTITYSGGTAVSQRITSVSAWVAYFPGLDTATHTLGGHDTATLSVQALGTLHGVDTLVGTGIVQILPSTSYTMITANITYFDTTRWVDLIRISFTSSARVALDSSTLFVDDVTMIGIAQDTVVVADTTADTISHTGIKNIVAKPVKVYPNPASNVIFLESPLNTALHFELLSVSGVRVAAKTVSRKDKVDVSGMAPGMYFYILRDDEGNVMQRDKLMLEQ
jgi:Secretion system C-terminal sorting domain